MSGLIRNFQQDLNHGLKLKKVLSFINPNGPTVYKVDFFSRTIFSETFVLVTGFYM